MAQPCLVYFKVWKDWDKLISIGHGFKLFLLEVWGKSNRSFNVDFDEHELINEAFAKVRKMS